MDLTQYKIAVLVPCYNEAVAIPTVVHDFHQALPQASVYVYDNNSRDDTVRVATEAGAIVRTEERQGKGNVVRRMFADIDADFYLLVDGDDTYDAASAKKMIETAITRKADMVVANREHQAAAAYRPGHVWGNKMLSGLLSQIFGQSCTDILSGYRVFTKRFVKSFPALSGGFEIETELTVHALELRMTIAEFVTPYKERPIGSQSKLNTYRDGVRILLTMMRLFAAERPLTVYGLIALLLATIAIALSVPLFLTYMQTGFVPRFPTAILSTGLIILSAFSIFAGLILDTVTRGRRELKILHYLGFRAPF